MTEFEDFDEAMRRYAHEHERWITTAVYYRHVLQADPVLDRAFLAYTRDKLRALWADERFDATEVL